MSELNQLGVYQSSKVFDGYSACFRQWRAEGTHCKFLHGYAISFEVWFEGELDHRNWVFDFGGMKRSQTTIDGRYPKDYFDWLLDHTTIVAQDDPQIELFRKLDRLGAIQLRVLPAVGCEKFAQFIFDKIYDWVNQETQGRVRVIKVEVREHSKNAASYQLI